MADRYKIQPQDGCMAVFPFVDQESWLLVLLTTLDDRSLETLLHQLRPRTAATDIWLGQTNVGSRVKVQTWSPSKSLLGLIAFQGPHRDNQANLHALGTLGYRLGVSRFIVADEATKRELRDYNISPKTQKLSVVLISAQEHARKPKNVCVATRRASCSGKHIGLMFRDFKWAEGVHPATDRFDLSLASKGSIWNLFGLLLHDPERELFSSEERTVPLWEERAVAMQEALSKLPQEIIFNISKLVEYSPSEAQMIKMPLWRKRPTRYHLVILLFFDASTKQFDDTLSKMDEYFRKHPKNQITESTTFELIPFGRHKIKSRRNLMDFFETYLSWNANISVCGMKFPPLHFLLHPPRETTCIQLVELLSFGPPPAVATPTTLDSVIHRNLNGISHVNSEVHGGVYRNENSEIICDPSQPFHDKPSWAPGPIAQREWMPVFYLTASLTEDQDRGIRDAIKSKCSQDPDYNVGRKLCGFVTWKTGEAGKLDGTTEDIWEITKMVYLYALPRGLAYNFICVDRSSADDESVLLVMPDCSMQGVNYGGVDHIPLPCLRGFTYARIPAQKAHVTRNSLEWDQATAGVDGQCSHYVRPDWPGEGTFPVEDEPPISRRRDTLPIERHG